MRTNTWRCAAALVCLAASPSLAFGQSIEIVPPANASTNGGSSNSIPLGAASGGTYMVLYEPSQLVGLPIGGRITSLQLRQSNLETAPWPSANATFSDYEIRIGTSTRTAATMSLTYADNLTGAVLVRDGALSLPANVYPGGGASGATPEDWGPVITFSTPYTYSGGPLVLEFRNTGVTAPLQFADCATPAVAASAIGSAASKTATSGFGVALPLIVRLGVEPPNTQTVTLPNANATVSDVAGGGNSIPLGVFTNGRHMSLFDASQFAAVPPGSLITGMQLRLRNEESSGWPGADSTNADYEIWLSQSSLTPGTMSNTYAANQLNPVRVRDGALFLPANAYPAGAATGTTPEPWGPLIAFDQPYVYNGGVLAIDIRSAGGILPVRFADTVDASGIANGKTASPRDAALGGGSSAFIVRLSFVPPVESPFGDGVTKIFALKQFADTPAGNAFQGFTQSANFTTQYLFGPEQFQTVGPGTWITALSLRNAIAAAWPPALGVYPQFDLRLSKSPLTPGTMSTTVASNTGADAVTVRAGSLDVPAGSLAAKPGGTTAPYTWTIPFAENYSYRSGTLDMLINNQPFPGGAGQVDAISASNVALRPFGRGKFALSLAAATVATSGNVPVARFSADAQVIVPNAAKDGDGFLNLIDTPYASTPKTLQQIIAASELSFIPVGGLITSLSFINDGAAWPGATGAFADDYSVEISTAVNRPDSMSTTFANNVGGDALIVRSGPIAWQPGSLPVRSSGRYGGTITFDQGFVYNGGDLCITIRHSGVVGGSASVITGGNSTNNRGVFDNSSKVSESGSFFLVTNAGTIMQLGYIPSAVSPKNVLAADGNGGRSAFAGTRAYQMIYDANQVGVPVGATINGVSFRLDDGFASAFPAADLTLDRFDITMSSATNSAATMSDTFASNEGADVTTVRSGPLTIPAASYPPNADGGRRFGLFIPFTRPFVYKGGPITMLLRNGIASGASTNFNVDAHSVGANGRRDTTSADAVSGANLGNALAARFAFTDDAFCPWDLNNDGVVNDDDFQVFVLAYNILDCADAAMPLGCPSDFTFDRVVNDDDFLPFVQAYNDLLCP
jgi:hypothetical protein